MNAPTSSAEQQRPIAVITAGGTQEPIDEVRHIANVATGALPCAIAEALMARGWEVAYIAGPDAHLPGQGRVHLDVTSADWPARWHEQEIRLQRLAKRIAHGWIHHYPVRTAAQAAETLESVCRTAQPLLTVCAMAVADFSPEPVAGKLSSRQDGRATMPYPGKVGRAEASGDELVLFLQPTAKAIDRVRAAAPNTRLVGFKLLAGADDDALVAASKHLAQRCAADLVFANDIRTYRQGVRSGLLIAGDGAVLARLDGGHGEDATARLAELIVQSAAKGLPPQGGDALGPTRRVRA